MNALLNGNRSRGLIFIVSAPAGTGKTTLVKLLIEEFKEIIPSISYTTRSPRSAEKEGRDYYFIKESDFKAKIDAADFLEYVKLYGTYYGTSKSWVYKQLDAGKHVVLVIDTQGALQLKEKFADFTVFIRPPSLEILRERLINRKTETQSVIEQRLAWAERELESANSYDYQIINDDLTVAYQTLKSIIIAESHKTINLN